MIDHGLKWHFPESTDEAENLVAEGATLCAGGTFLIRRGVSKIRDLVDMNRLSLDGIENSNGEIFIGAMANYADVLRVLPGDSLLVKSLASAASTPLRNQITIGGSIAAFPMWSNVIGPLLALDAKVHLSGNGGSAMPLEKFLEDRKLQTGRLILGVEFEEKGWRNYFFSAKRTVFDYSAFNISMFADIDDGRIADIRLVLVGCKRKYRRLSDVESALRGSSIDRIKLVGIGKKALAEFGNKPMGGKDYLRHLFEIELERGLNKLLRGE
jgi:CO/xanthine dehydrogenase FAD-binding subunit